MLQVGQVQNYVEFGYDLLIHKLGEKEYTGTVILFEHPLSILDIREVDVQKFLDFFPHIQKKLTTHVTLESDYSYPERKIVTRFQKEVWKGPYGEEKSYETVDGLQVKTEDLFSAFMELEQQLANQYEESEKLLIKKGN